MVGGSRHGTGGSDQDNPQEKQMQKGKMVASGRLRKERKVKVRDIRKDISI